MNALGTCYFCGGRGYVSDGQPEDGMMTGRARCYVCQGSGQISADAALGEIARILKGFG